MSTKNSKHLISITTLPLLLDDNIKGIEPHQWQELFRESLKAKSKRAPTSTAVQTSPVQKIAPSPRIFKSAPSFEQLMSEYNRSNLRPNLIKSTTSKPTSRDFQADQIEFIDIPSIPGKVLRPT